MNDKDPKAVGLYSAFLYLVFFALLYLYLKFVLDGFVYKWIESSAFYPSLPFLFIEIKNLILCTLLLACSLLDSIIVFCIFVWKKEYLSPSNLFNPIKIKTFFIYAIVFSIAALLNGLVLAPWSEWAVRDIGGRSLTRIIHDAIYYFNLSENLFSVEIQEGGVLKTTNQMFFMFVFLSYVTAGVKEYISALFEEFLYRGPMLIYLKDTIGLKSAIIIVSMIFALMHAPRHNQIYTISIYANAFSFSVLMSFLFIKTHNILFTSTLHLLWNLITSFIGGNNSLSILVQRLIIPENKVLFFNLYCVGGTLIIIGLLFLFSKFYNTLPYKINESNFNTGFS